MARASKDYKDQKLQDVLKRFSENLKKVRLKNEMSQVQLAAKTGSSISTISAIEMGAVKDIRLSTVTGFANALGVTNPIDLLK